MRLNPASELFTCTLIFVVVTQEDRARADFHRVLAQLREHSVADVAVVVVSAVDGVTAGTRAAWASS